MPGFTTHYLFGVTTYKELNDYFLKDLIHENPTVYGLGLQGPDIFFYYLPSHLIHGKNLGSIAHSTHTGDFLKALLESRNLFPETVNQHIAIAYILGFLGHYTLDTFCHPYIYAKSHYRGEKPGYFGHHVYLETDIDVAFLSFYKGMLPSMFHQETTICLSHAQRQVVATVLHYVYSKVYPELQISYATMYAAICSMHAGTHAIHDPYGKKKVMVRKLESILVGHPVISPLIPSDHLHFVVDPCNMNHKSWKNPWDTSMLSNDSFFDLFESARENYKKTLLLAGKFLSTNEPVDLQNSLMKLLKYLGGRSYHSGLECE